LIWKMTAANRDRDGRESARYCSPPLLLAVQDLDLKVH
jgi:hypothetical protein